MWLLSIAASYTRESRGSHELFSVAVLGITLLLWHFVVAPKQTLIFLFNWLRLFFVGRHMRLCYSNSLSLICQTFRQMFWFFINKLKARQFCIRESFVSRKQTVDKWSLCWHDLLTSGLKKNPMHTCNQNEFKMVLYTDAVVQNVTQAMCANQTPFDILRTAGHSPSKLGELYLHWGIISFDISSFHFRCSARKRICCYVSFGHRTSKSKSMSNHV